MFDTPWPDEERLEQAILLLEQIQKDEQMDVTDRCKATALSTSMCYLYEHEDYDWNHYRNLVDKDMWRLLGMALKHAPVPTQPHQCLAFAWVKEDIQRATFSS